MSRFYSLRIVAVLAAILAPSVAWAHAILEDSTPAAGGSVKAGPIDFRLRYNSRIDRARSRLTLTGPGQEQSQPKISADGPPDVMTTHLDLKPGNYVLRWQVLAIDGHITRGDVPFSVTGP